MTRLTTWLAIGFFVIAFGLAYTAKERSEQADRLGIPQVINGASENTTDLPSADDLIAPASDEQSNEIPEI